MRGEIPPTAGLVPKAGDLWAGFVGANHFCSMLEPWLPFASPLITSSATAALYLVFSFLKTRSARRTVIVPAYSCPLVVQAAARAGLQVVLCDTQADRLDFDLASLAELLNADTLCVMPTHFGGALVDGAAIAKLVRGYCADIFIVEDCAQALGACWSAQPVGTLADFAVFSFTVGKGFTLYEGGCVVSAHAEWHQALAALQHDLLPRRPVLELQRILALIGYHMFYNPSGLRLTYGAALRRHLRHGDIEAAIGDRLPDDMALFTPGQWRQRFGTRALNRLGPALQQNRQQRALMEAHWRSHTHLMVYPHHAAACPSSTFAFVLSHTAAQRQKILSRLWTRGIGLTLLYSKLLNQYEWLQPYIRPRAHVPQAAALTTRLLTVSTSAYGGHDLEQRLTLIDESAHS